MLDNVIVVVRSAHERTEALCLHIVQEQIPTDRLILIHERPFTAALRRSFEIGLDYGADWTLCLDADVLIQRDSIKNLLEEATQLSDDIFTLSGYVFDKLQGVRLPGGLHLYRTSLLHKALPLIPESPISPDNTSFYEKNTPREELWYSPILRPETFVKGEMKKLGHTWARIDEDLGLHDFEQYYADIFRKMVVRAIKSPHKSHSMLKRAQTFAMVDPDFLIASWGIRAGMGLSEQVYLDVKQWESEAKVLLLANNIQEKGYLSIEEGIVQFEEAYEYCCLQEGHGFPKTKGNCAQKSVMSAFYSAIWRLGWKVNRIGLRLQRIAMKKIKIR